MYRELRFLILLVVLFQTKFNNAQINSDPGLLNLDRVFASGEFRQQHERPVQWIDGGKSYVTIERSPMKQGADELVQYNSLTQERSLFVPADVLSANGNQLIIESFSLSPDESKVLFFTNSSRVWRSNTKGDFWVYDFATKKLKQLGSKFEPSSLMFAKFSPDNKYVAYVHGFNLYLEDYENGTITQLTFDGNGKIINGTFDWAYEEEFGKRDGFSWSPDGKNIAFWQLDASEIGTFYLINNTDSIYSKPIPIQYPKVGQEPSGAKVGIIELSSKEVHWIPIEGGEKENYIPGLQWVNEDLLLIQQLNRKQNELKVWSFVPSNKKLTKVYSEVEKTYVDLVYQDISYNRWAKNDLPIVDKGKAFLRMTETDGWRRVYKINISTGSKILITTGEYDVASICRATPKVLYFMASPTNSMQRYLYSANISGKGKPQRITPPNFEGVNTYNVTPNGTIAIHVHESSKEVRTVRVVQLPKHKNLTVLVNNKAYKEKLETLKLPEIKFSSVKTADGVEMDVRMILPVNFDPNKKYPVLFSVYGEPGSQSATDSQTGLFNVLLAQKGYVIIDMDNRGTPCLKGSEWRKSIYRKVGVLNTRDQALAAKELLKIDYLDEKRVAIWGWSGGGTTTLNLMFQYPEIYKTGMAVAPVPDLLLYDNIYQERYMGLPQENMRDYANGSPITHARNLEGKLLVVHGTGDDNVHYQGTERLINELIKHNKQFRMMAYPNRSHGIYEGRNTRRHLFTMLLNFLMENTPVN